MPKKPSDVDVWLGRETPRIRRALESASRYFDSKDHLTVNTLEAVYARENSFGILMGKRGSIRKEFILGAFNAGEGRIARAQHLAQEDGKDPHLWSAVVNYIAAAKAGPKKQEETRAYVEMVPLFEEEFAKKSPANKNLKEKGVRKGRYLCTEGHWVTIDDRPVFICD